MLDICCVTTCQSVVYVDIVSDRPAVPDI